MLWSRCKTENTACALGCCEFLTILLGNLLLVISHISKRCSELHVSITTLKVVNTNTSSVLVERLSKFGEHQKKKDKKQDYQHGPPAGSRSTCRCDEPLDGKRAACAHCRCWLSWWLTATDSARSRSIQTGKTPGTRNLVVPDSHDEKRAGERLLSKLKLISLYW